MRVSIITVSLNPGDIVQRTIGSIVNQTYSEIEWVVVDGGSTDGSRERYGQVRERIALLISERDKGISDAMNKGLYKATGDALIYINAGDEFADEQTLQRMVSAWNSEVYQWATGAGVVYSADGEMLYVRRVDGVSAEDLVKRGCRIIHAATIVKRETLMGAGGFSTMFKSSMDYELWLRLISRRIYPQLLSFPVAKFYIGGISSGLLRRYREDLRDGASAIKRPMILVPLVGPYGLALSMPGCSRRRKSAALRAGSRCLSGKIN